MSEPVRKTVRANNIHLSVVEWEGRGNPILCIHGLSANARCWDSIASSLATDFHLVAVDLRGRGKSDKPVSGYSIDVHVRDLYSLSKKMKLRKPILMGHSLGAYIALAAAAEHPDLIDAIILIDGGGTLNPEQKEQFQNAIKPALDRLEKTFPSFDEYVAPMKVAPFFQPWTAALENYFTNDVRDVPGGVASVVASETIIEEAINLQEVDFRTVYPLIQCETLILRATKGIVSPQDLLLPDYAVDEMMATIRQATRIDVPDTNHYSIVFQPNACRDRILRTFLAARQSAQTAKKRTKEDLHEN